MNIIEKAGKMLDLPLEYAAGAYRVEMTGGSEVKVEQHHGIVQYSAELITVKGAGADIIIRGEALTLRTMTDDEILIDGRIDGIELGR